MTDTIQKIADEMRENRGNHLPAHVREWADRLTALSARASAGEGGDAAIAQAFREVECGNSEAAIYRQRVMKRADELTAAPQPATGEEDSPQDISWWVRRLKVQESITDKYVARVAELESSQPAAAQGEECKCALCDALNMPPESRRRVHKLIAKHPELFPHTTPPAHSDGEGDAWTYPNRNALIREVCEGLRGYRFDVDPVCVMAIINSIPAQVFSRMAPPALTTRPTPEANAPPVNCRARLMAEGKPYARSSCAVCGHFSPRHKECIAALALPAQGEGE